MLVREARQMAMELFKQYNIDTTWKLKFMAHSRWLGCCMFNKKTIYLNLAYVANAPPEVIRNTIIHEIAHALLPWQVHHGVQWKQLFRRMGGDGKRCTRVNYNSRNVIRIELKGQIVMGGTKIQTYHGDILTFIQFDNRKKVRPYIFAMDVNGKTKFVNVNQLWIYKNMVKVYSTPVYNQK